MRRLSRLQMIRKRERMEKKRDPAALQGGQTMVKGAVVLLIATGLVKMIGAFFKIPLANLLGGEGMGYFSTAYGLFNPVYAVSVAGLPVALSKLVSQYRAQGRVTDVKRLYRLSWFLFAVIGLLGTAAIYFFAEPFCAATGNPLAVLSVKMMAPSLLFGCMMSVYRGYYQGMGNMNPTAYSQLAEALAKLFFGILAIVLVRRMGMEQFSRTGMLFGLSPSSQEEAEKMLGPFSSAGAIAGVAVSTLVGVLFLAGYHFFTGRRGKYKLRPQQSPYSYWDLAKTLAKVAVPVCLGAVVVNLTGVIDLFTVMNGLEKAMTTDSQRLIATLPAACSMAVSPENLPNFLYGSYQGLAVNLYTLLPAITSAFGVSALPAISAAFARKDQQAVEKQVHTVLNLTLLLAVPAGMGLCVLSKPILTLLYPGRAPEVAVAAPLLAQLGITGIFVAVSMPVNSMLQAVGRADIPVKAMLWGAGLKLALNLLLISHPAVHINGAPYGSLGCYALLAIVGIGSLCRILGIKPQVKKWCGIFAASFGCAFLAWGSSRLGSRIFPESFSTLAAILTGMGGYLAILQFLGVDFGKKGKLSLSIRKNGKNT